METGSTSCTECGALIPSDRSLCPRCHRPRWYTLKKVSVCMVVVVVLAILIRCAVQFGDRIMTMWPG
jgi:hypothetical protein